MQFRDNILIWVIIIIITGAILLASIGIPIITIGQGHLKYWLWDNQSWQTLATAATGYALVSFAAIQVFEMLKQRTMESTRTRQATLSLLTTIILRILTNQGRHELLISRLSYNTNVLRRYPKLLPQLRIERTDLERHLEDVKKIHEEIKAQTHPSKDDIVQSYLRVLIMDAAIQPVLVEQWERVVDFYIKKEDLMHRRLYTTSPR